MLHTVRPEQIVSAVLDPLQVFIDSSLLQGLPGSKGEKGERVSGSFYAKKEIINTVALQFLVDGE